LWLGWLFDELQLKLTEELGEWCAALFERGVVAGGKVLKYKVGSSNSLHAFAGR
jgi:hypothetical protein